MSYRGLRARYKAFAGILFFGPMLLFLAWLIFLKFFFVT